MRPLILLLLLTCGCSPHSSEEFQREGKAQCRTLSEQLSKIESQEQLLKAEPELKKAFEALVTLMIEAREFQQKHLDVVAIEMEGKEEELLQEHLRRIYGLEGGREVIERAQQEALVRLDAYERILSKKRAQPLKK